MTDILNVIIDILTFGVDPIASVIFYVALIVIPAVVHFVGIKSPVAGSRILNMATQGLKIVIFVAGIILFALIFTDGNKYKFGDDVDGKKVEAFWAKQDLNAPIVYEEGVFYKKKNLRAEDNEAELVASGEYLVYDNHPYEVMETGQPEVDDIYTLILEGGETRTMLEGSFYDEGIIGSSIGMSILVVLICFGLMLGFGLTMLLNEPKKAIKPLAIFGGLVLIIVISYAMEGSFFEPLSKEYLDLAEGTSGDGLYKEVADYEQKDAGGSILAALVLVVLATVTTIGLSVYNSIAKARK